MQWEKNKYYILWVCVCVCVCVFVALGIQDAMRILLYCLFWPARLRNIFPHYFIKGKPSEK